eukprot:1157418-Pelagomonas_calceolata.AAC.4
MDALLLQPSEYVCACCVVIRNAYDTATAGGAGVVGCLPRGVWQELQLLLGMHAADVALATQAALQLSSSVPPCRPVYSGVAPGPDQELPAECAAVDDDGAVRKPGRLAGGLPGGQGGQCDGCAQGESHARTPACVVAAVVCERVVNCS